MRCYHSMLLLGMVLSLVFSLSSCADLVGGADPGDSERESTSAHEVYVRENVVTDTTWTADKSYFIRESIYVRAHLTIEAGTRVYVAQGKWLSADSGTITAAGTAEDPVLFTADGPGAPGFWQGLDVQESGSSFEHLTVAYADIGLDVHQASAAIRNSAFAFCSQYGVEASTAQSGTEITGNTFYGNRIPLRINGAYSLDDSNAFCNPEEPSVSNTYNGIYHGTNIIEAVSWSETEVPYVVEDSFYVRAPWTLAPGLVIKVKENHWIAHEEDNGYLTETSIENAVFTAYADDSRLGDTDNGDEAPPSAGTDYWGGISVLVSNGCDTFPTDPDADDNVLTNGDYPDNIFFTTP